MRIALGYFNYLFFRITVKRNQLIWKSKVSRPFLSADLFISLCDFSFLDNMTLDDDAKSRLKGANSIFCRSDLFEYFLENYSEFVTAKIILCGMSDRDFTELPSNIPKSVRALFLQNSFISDSRFIYTLPIGLENLSLGINGNPKLLRPARINDEMKCKVLAGPFSPTHVIRELFAEMYFDSIKDLIVVKGRVTPQQYSKLVSCFKFVLALRGNGVDTHRFWETLYRGSVPIVQTSNWSKSVAELGIPLIEVPDLQYETIEASIRAWGSKEIVPREILPLWEDFWRNLFDSKIYFE